MSQSAFSTPATGRHVGELDDLKSVENLRRARPSVLLAIVHPFSPRCKRFFPIYEVACMFHAIIAASLLTSGSEIKCAQVPPADPELTSKFGATAYPTVVLCHGTSDHTTYHGPLRKDDILAFLVRQDMPAVTKIGSSTALNDIRSAHNTLVVAYLSQDNQTARTHFQAVANDMKDDFVGISHDPKLAAQEGVSIPSVVIYKHVADEKSVLRNPLTSDAIRDFVRTAAHPLITDFLPELVEAMLEQSLPLGYIFVSSPFQQQQANVDFLSTARKYQGRVHMGTVDVNLFTDLAEKMHLLQSDQWPAFAIHEPSRNERYPLNHTDKAPAHLGYELVDRFIGDFLAGNLKPTIKSQPIPDVQAGPVIEIVGWNYHDVVLDPNKDVLVEFYTQWCGPCKALQPAYEQLASLYASDPKARELVVIAKLDYDANDVPDRDIRGFPWFKLYPAGRKKSPVTYTKGERRVADWAKFIAENGTHGRDLDLK